MASGNKSIYEPLDYSRTEIRLLWIKSEPGERPMRVELKRRSLDGQRWFALSYVWGSLSSEEKLLVNDGIEFEVGSNLMEALTELDKNMLFRRKLWIDAICINQQDNAEKRNQVRLMSRIYKQASGVLVWLGPADNDSSLVFKLLKTMADELEKNPAINQEILPGFYSESWLAKPEYGEIASRFSYDDIFAPIHDLFYRRPYWTRVWTFQELSLSRFGPFSSFLCGSDMLTCLDLLKVIGWKAKRKNKKSVFGDINPRIGSLVHTMMAGESPWSLFSYATLELPNCQGPPWNVESRNLVLIVQQTAAKRQANDPRDKLFGLAGIVDLGIDVNYDMSVSRVYRDFAVYQIGTVDNLSFFLEYAGVSRSSPRLMLPSWTPDWDFVSKESLRVWRGVTHGNPYSANKGMEKTSSRVVSGDILELPGVICDTVQDVMTFLSDVSDTSQERDTRALSFLFGCSIAEAIKNLTSGRIGVYKTGIPMLQAIFRTYCQDKHPINKALRLDVSNPTFDSEAAAFLRLLASLKLHEDIISSVQEREDVTLSLLERLVKDQHSAATSSPPSISDVFQRSGQIFDSWDSILNAATLQINEGFLSNLAEPSVIEQSPFSRYKLQPLRTRQGYIGYARATVHAGDIVCASSASSMPFVLRRQQNGYRFVSNCFLLGFMDGEVKSGLDSGAFELETFSIY
ncbi:heterokaryon incompatibility protein-domain-containing protein [Leptodontidium sp. MPI-SDFR-AT-0119]|nr:heterokaryon incompatibility protein-domain-containing protein [Leptodontidium sp. MPI-SDFR-AT-0119]